MPQIHKIKCEKYSLKTQNTKPDKTDSTSYLKNRYFSLVLPRHTYLFYAKGAERGLV